MSELLVDDYLKMLNDPDVYKFISKEPRTFEYKDELNWVKKKIANNSMVFSMIEKTTKEFIGNVEIMEVDKNNIAELGICITADKQNKHYGSEAIKAIIRYGFDTYNLDGYDLNVYNSNGRAIKCYENVGFVIDGPGNDPEDLHMRYKK